jgi:hypothetical protein
VQHLLRYADIRTTAVRLYLVDADPRRKIPERG